MRSDNMNSKIKEIVSVIFELFEDGWDFNEHPSDYSFDQLKEKIFEKIPFPYRFFVKIFLNHYLNLPWDKSIDELNKYLKELGKDENGNYKKTSEVLDEILKKGIVYLNGGKTWTSKN